MKPILKTTAILFVSLLLTNCLKAQTKPVFNYNPKIKHSVADSLYNQFQSDVYYSFYNPTYMSNTTTTSTIMKVDIDWQGKVTDINFSDSADSIFVKVYRNHLKIHDDKVLLEKYAKSKSLTNISLLIPVNYEPNYPHQRKTFSYDELEGLIKFNKRSFTGKSIIFEPINIAVLTRGNM